MDKTIGTPSVDEHDVLPVHRALDEQDADSVVIVGLARSLTVNDLAPTTSSPTVVDDLASKQVSWFPVHEYVSALIAQSGVERWPVIGTPAWCSLHADDPQKFVAVLDAAQHAALNWDGRQEALAAAASDVSEAEDWRQVGNEIVQRETYFEAHPWMKRRTA